MGNNPIIGVDPDGGYSFWGALKNSGFNIFRMYRSGTDNGKAVWGYRKDGIHYFGEDKGPFIPTIKAYEPNFFQRWSTNTNFFASAGYGIVNGAYLTSHFFMPWKEVTNLDGSWATPDERVAGFASTAGFMFGGGASSSISATTADGFLFGSIGFRTPVTLKVGLYVSEKTMKYGTFNWSTMAPKVLSNYHWFGRRMLQITPDFQSTLGQWSSQIIPKGTYIRIGLVGPQNGAGFGTWLQLYAPKGVNFIK
jgi:hypothetical protein